MINWQRIIALGSLVLIGFSATNLHSQQSSFRTIPNQQQVLFTYKWQHESSHYQLEFAIPRNALYAMPDSPATYNPKRLQNFVYRKVMLEAQKVDPKTGSIQVIKNTDGLRFKVKSSSRDKAQQILDQLTLVNKQAEQEYWQQHYYVEYAGPSGGRSIRHDHAKYVEHSYAILEPIVKAIKQLQTKTNDPREFIQIALSWIQNIPYDQIQNRLSSNGSGFISPRDLMLQNKGDCDSKSTLMAALLKAYSPKINVQMIYLPEHALLGVAMLAKHDETTIFHNGVELVLLEPTGPALLPLGEIADDSMLAIRNRQYDISAL